MPPWLLGGKAVEHLEVKRGEIPTLLCIQSERLILTC